MLKQISGSIVALASVMTNVSCKKEYETIKDVDARTIADFIVRNNLKQMVEDAEQTGYYYHILEPGSGDLLQNTDSVLYQIQMKGMDNGTVYYESSASTNRGTFVGYTDLVTHEYIVNTVPKTPTAAVRSIPAIRNVMLQLRRGGSARILLPSHLAFGRNGAGDIPANQNMDILITTHPDLTQMDRDDRLILDFVTGKGLNMTKDPSGVWYSISAAGDDTLPVTETSTLQTNYTGRFLNGTVFQLGSSISNELSPVPALQPWISGWRKVIPGRLRKGGKMRMIIPSRLATGKSDLRDGNGNVIVPANAILDFDVEILSVKP